MGNERQEHRQPNGDDSRHPDHAEVKPLLAVHAHGLSSTDVIRVLALPWSLLREMHQVSNQHFYKWHFISMPYGPVKQQER